VALWASDSLIESVHRECHSLSPKYLVGPHHGAPEDRANDNAGRWLKEIHAETNFISVGKNQYNHPQKSYIRNSLKAGSKVICSQLTKLCDKNHKTDLIKSHARLGLPQPNNGIGCRGPVRLTLRGDEFMGDNLDNEHQHEIQRLQRPQCIKLLPKINAPPKSGN